MKISFNWLKNYIETDLNAIEVAEILTSTGLEVESVEKIETIKGGLVGVVVGEVLTKEKHADADRLNVTTVDIGVGTDLQIVCGASNVAVGQKVLVATIGATIYPDPEKPLKIKKSKIRGVESEGMICAEDELGLGNSHDGILVLPQNSEVGTLAKELYKIEEDYLFEIGLTPNRADAMGHIGVARDLKAHVNFHQKKKFSLHIPVIKNEIINASNEIKVNILDIKACPRYRGAVIKNIQVNESPKWLQNKLRIIGLKPINNIVDITNFVMFETGNPLHAFDLEKTGNEIIVRKAKAGEKINTLDGSERTLSVEDLVICNESQPLCIAGIFGGSESGITESTKNVFLETAFFNAATIRRTAKSQGFNTDSSFRFERGVDPNNIEFASERAISLILEIAGGELVQVNDSYPDPVERVKTEFSFEHCRKLCGAKISNEEISLILNELEIEINAKNNGTISLLIPTYRVDVKREADVFEEVLRIYGFNAVPIPEKLNSSISHRPKPNSEKIYNLVADLLSDSGYYEIMNNSLMSSGISGKFKSKTVDTRNNISILNPLSNELDILRQTLIFGGLNSIEFNQNRQSPNLKLFEFGKVYTKSDSGYNESRKLSIFITGDRDDENWTTKAEKSNFYTLKGVVEKILARLGLNEDHTYETVENDLIEDGYSIYIRQNKIADLGWIKQFVQKEMDIKNRVFYAELEWDSLLKLASKSEIRFKTIPKTQFVRRDYSLLLNENIKFEQIKNLALKSEKKILNNIGLFDVYEGKNLPQGKKSYAVSFIFQDDEKTLQDAQVEAIMQSIKSSFEQNLGAELR